MWTPRFVFVRVRWTVRKLMVVVAVVAVLLAGVELVRRWVKPGPPLPWPWGAPAQLVNHDSLLYVNMEDVRRGIDPPRAKWVHFDYRGGYRIEDAPGALRPGWARRTGGLHYP